MWQALDTQMFPAALSLKCPNCRPLTIFNFSEVINGQLGTDGLILPVPQGSHIALCFRKSWDFVPTTGSGVLSQTQLFVKFSQKIICLGTVHINIMEHTVHERGDILSMNEVIVVEVFDGQYNLTSGMSFV